MYLKKIAEQVLRRHNNGDPSSDNNVKLKEIYIHIVQAINKRLKVEQLNVNMPLMEMVPPYASIATYSVPISETGFKTVNFERDNIGAPLTNQFYTTPSGQYWMDANGDFFVAASATAVLSVSQISVAVWSISITGFGEINNITYQDIVDFFSSNSTYLNPTKEPGYFSIQGLTGSTASSFASDGVTSVALLSNGFSFVYDLSKTVSTSTDILQYVYGTHSSILSGTFDIELVSIDFYRMVVNETSSAKSVATLPAQPINLPRGLGVWRVFDPKNPTVSWIPIQSGESFLLDGMISTSMELINTYECHDNYTIYFNKAASDMPATMNVQLVVVDIDQLGEFDPLPIPPEMEEEVIVDVLKIIGVQESEDNLSDGNPNAR